MFKVKTNLGSLVSSIVLCFCVFSASAAVVIPPAPSVAAKGFILMDFQTGNVIAEQNADIQIPPASLTKMMTSYVIGVEIANGNITETDLVTISENAWAKNFPDSSKMFIEVGKKISVADKLFHLVSTLFPAM